MNHEREPLSGAQKEGVAEAREKGEKRYLFAQRKKDHVLAHMDDYCGDDLDKHLAVGYFLKTGEVIDGTDWALQELTEQLHGERVSDNEKRLKKLQKDIQEMISTGKSDACGPMGWEELLDDFTEKGGRLSTLEDYNGTPLTVRKIEQMELAFWRLQAQKSLDALEHDEPAGYIESDLDTFFEKGGKPEELVLSNGAFLDEGMLEDLKKKFATGRLVRTIKTMRKDPSQFFGGVFEEFKEKFGQLRPLAIPGQSSFMPKELDELYLKHLAYHISENIKKLEAGKAVRGEDLVDQIARYQKRGGKLASFATQDGNPVNGSYIHYLLSQ